MKRLEFDITYNYEDCVGEAYCRLTLCGVDGAKVVLELDKQQYALIEARRTRSFFVRCKMPAVMSEIDNAGSYAALEEIAKKYYLCDFCSFKDINLYGVKRILKVVVTALYKYPMLRSRLCFIGTQAAMEKLLAEMENGNEIILNDFNLQYICSAETAKIIGQLTRGILKRVTDKHSNYIALAMGAYGLLDAMLLERNDYDGYAYLNLVSSLRKSEETGFHPKGCHTPESVAYHELGHLLDYMCGLSDRAEFRTYYESLSETQIKKGLSKYALESDKEFIAEAFAEYMCNPAPREIAVRVGELLDEAYKKISRS